MIQVKAVKLGYYGLKRKREGEVFSIKSEKEFSQNWMEKLEEDNDGSDAPVVHSKKAHKGKAKAKHHHQEPAEEQSEESSGDASVI